VKNAPCGPKPPVCLCQSGSSGLDAVDFAADAKSRLGSLAELTLLRGRKIPHPPNSANDP
jgi:hypothetical protein